jgi:hypothetical protein
MAFSHTSVGRSSLGESNERLGSSHRPFLLVSPVPPPDRHGSEDAHETARTPQQSSREI